VWLLLKRIRPAVMAESLNTVWLTVMAERKSASALIVFGMPPDQLPVTL
jgi:hypothetical protein